MSGDNQPPRASGDEEAGMFRLPKHRFAEARYVIAGSGTNRAVWARYEIGCELCGFWTFEARRWKAYWRVFRHRCAGGKS